MKVVDGSGRKMYFSWVSCSRSIAITNEKVYGSSKNTSRRIVGTNMVVVDICTFHGSPAVEVLPLHTKKYMKVVEIIIVEFLELIW